MDEDAFVCKWNNNNDVLSVSLFHLLVSHGPRSNGCAPQTRSDLWLRASATGGTANKQGGCGDGERKERQTDQKRMCPCVCVCVCDITLEGSILLEMVSE